MEKLIASSYYRNEIRYDYEVDGVVVGAMSVELADNYIHSLEIEEEYRNRGYARQMLRAVMELYAGQRMYLKAWATNTPAIKAYTAVGFTIYERGPYSKYEPQEVVSMEITAPVRKVAFKRKYGLMAIEEDYEHLFDTEEERNEVAMELHAEIAHALWARTFNWYESFNDTSDWEMEYEARRAYWDAMDAIYCYEEIVMEEV